MYISTWNKYLPVIKIILKRALLSDQVLKLNASDFERAANSRKTNIRFSIESSNGKFPNVSKYPPVAKDLVSILMQDAVVKELLLQNNFAMALTTKYELSFRLVSKLVANPLDADALPIPSQ